VPDGTGAARSRVGEQEKNCVHLYCLLFPYNLYKNDWSPSILHPA